MEVKIENKIKNEVLLKHLFENKKKYFYGKENEIYETIENDQIIIYYGLGKKEEYNLKKLKGSISSLIRYLQKRPFKECALEFNDEIIVKNKEETLKLITETIILSNHKNDLMKTKNKEETKLKTIIIKSNENNKIINENIIISNSINWAKDLVNLPSNVITPKNFVNEVKKNIKNVNIKVYGRNEIIKQKLNLVEAVSRSSENEPQFMIIEYKPKDIENKKPICLIGKGITFDTGGVSLKPSSFPGNYIRNMKCDMAGAASVVSILKILSENQINKWVIGITPLCENTLGGNSYKVDDVITSHSGLTVEIVNTDAEGRLILADALSYCKKYDPEIIIDIATLTGASLIAIGDRGACYMSNNEELSQKLEKTCKENDENIWRLPLWEEYRDLLKSDVADLMNLNEAKGPGTIIAGIFLNQFVDKPWIHVDIAASGFVDKDLPLSKKGATGICIKSLYEFIKK